MNKQTKLNISCTVPPTGRYFDDERPSSYYAHGRDGDDSASDMDGDGDIGFAQLSAAAFGDEDRSVGFAKPIDIPTHVRWSQVNVMSLHFFLLLFN